MRGRILIWGSLILVIISLSTLGIINLGLLNEFLGVSGKYPWLFEGAYATYYTDKVRLPEEFIVSHGDHIGRNVYFGWRIDDIDKDYFTATVWIEFEVGGDKVYQEKNIKVEIDTLKAFEGEKYIGNWYFTLDPNWMREGGKIVIFDNLLDRFSIEAYISTIPEVYKYFTPDDVKNIKESLNSLGETTFQVALNNYPPGISIERDNYLSREYGVEIDDLLFIGVIQNLDEKDMNYMEDYTLRHSGTGLIVTAFGYGLIYHERTGLLLSGEALPIDTIYYSLFGIYQFEMDRDLHDMGWLLLRSSFTLHQTNIPL